MRSSQKQSSKNEINIRDTRQIVKNNMRIDMTSGGYPFTFHRLPNRLDIVSLNNELWFCLSRLERRMKEKDIQEKHDKKGNIDNSYIFDVHAF